MTTLSLSLSAGALPPPDHADWGEAAALSGRPPAPGRQWCRLGAHPVLSICAEASRTRAHTPPCLGLFPGSRRAPEACANAVFFSLPVHGSVLSLASSASSTYSSVRTFPLLPSSPLLEPPWAGWGTQSLEPSAGTVAPLSGLANNP